MGEPPNKLTSSANPLQEDEFPLTPSTSLTALPGMFPRNAKDSLTHLETLGISGDKMKGLMENGPQSIKRVRKPSGALMDKSCRKDGKQKQTLVPPMSPCQMMEPRIVKGIRLSPGILFFPGVSPSRSYTIPFSLQNISKRSIRIEVLLPPTSAPFTLGKPNSYAILVPGFAHNDVITYQGEMISSQGSQDELPIHSCIFVVIDEEIHEYNIIVEPARPHLLVNPVEIDFGMVDSDCPLSVKYLELHNVGTIISSFSVHINDNTLGFSVYPCRGVVQVGTPAPLRVEFVSFKKTEGDYTRDIWIRSTTFALLVPVHVRVISPRLMLHHPMATGRFSFFDLGRTYYGTQHREVAVIRNMAAGASIFTLLAETDGDLLPLHEAAKHHEAFGAFYAFPGEGRMKSQEGKIFIFGFAPVKPQGGKLMREEEENRDQDYLIFLRVMRIQCIDFASIEKDIAELMVREGLGSEITDNGRKSTDPNHEDEAGRQSVEVETVKTKPTLSEEYIRVVLHGVAVLPNLIVQPSCLELGAMQSGEEARRVVRLTNADATLPLHYHYEKSAFVDVSPASAALDPRGSIELLVVIRPRNIGSAHTRLRLKLLAPSYKQLESVEMVEVGVSVIHVSYECFTKAAKPKPIFTQGLNPVVIREVGIVGDGVTLSTPGIPRMAMLRSDLYRDHEKLARVKLSKFHSVAPSQSNSCASPPVEAIKKTGETSVKTRAKLIGKPDKMPSAKTSPKLMEKGSKKPYVETSTNATMKTNANTNRKTSRNKSKGSDTHDVDSMTTDSSGQSTDMAKVIRDKQKLTKESRKLARDKREQMRNASKLKTGTSELKTEASKMTDSSEPVLHNPKRTLLLKGSVKPRHRVSISDETTVQLYASNCPRPSLEEPENHEAIPHSLCCVIPEKSLIKGNSEGNTRKSSLNFEKKCGTTSKRVSQKKSSCGQQTIFGDKPKSELPAVTLIGAPPLPAESHLRCVNSKKAAGPATRPAGRLVDIDTRGSNACNDDPEIPETSSPLLRKEMQDGDAGRDVMKIRQQKDICESDPNLQQQHCPLHRSTDDSLNPDDRDPPLDTIYVNKVFAKDLKRKTAANDPLIVLDVSKIAKDPERSPLVKPNPEKPSSTSVLPSPKESPAAEKSPRPCPPEPPSAQCDQSSPRADAGPKATTVLDALNGAQKEVLSAQRSFVALPNDMARCLRRGPEGAKFRTIFRGMLRYVPPPEPKYTYDQKALQKRQEIADHYLEEMRNYAAMIRERAARKLAGKVRPLPKEYAITNTRLYDIMGFQPSLKVPQTLKRESPVVKKSISTGAADSPESLAALLTPLSPLEAYNVRVQPHYFDFGKVVCETPARSHYEIFNGNCRHVAVRTMSPGSCLSVCDGQPFTMVPGERRKVSFEFSSSKMGPFMGCLSYVLNDSFAFSIPVKAEVVNRTLSLQQSELIFGYVQGKADTFPVDHHVIPVENAMRGQCAFKWLGFNNTCYQVLPRQGVVIGNSIQYCEIRYVANPAATSNEAHIVIEVEGGPSSRLMCRKVAPPAPRARFLKLQNELPNVPLNIRKEYYLLFFNGGFDDIALVLQNPEPCPGVSVRPVRAVAHARSMLKYKLSIKATEVGVFSFDIVVNVDFQDTTSTNVTVRVEYPNVCIEPAELHFGRVSSGALVSQALTFTNMGSTEAKVRMQGLGEDDLEQWSISASPSFPEPLCENGGVINLPPGPVPQTLYLQFRPTHVSVFKFLIPVLVNDLLGPPQLGDESSTLAATYLNPKSESGHQRTKRAQPQTLPTVYVEALVVRPVLSINSLFLSFIHNKSAPWDSILEHDIIIQNERNEHVTVFIPSIPFADDSAFSATPLSGSRELLSSGVPCEVTHSPECPISCTPEGFIHTLQELQLIDPEEGDIPAMEWPFGSGPQRGFLVMLVPNGRAALRVTFKPGTVSLNDAFVALYTDIFPENAACLVHLRGERTLPSLEASVKSVDFPPLPLNRRAQRTFYLVGRNHKSATAVEVVPVPLEEGDGPWAPRASLGLEISIENRPVLAGPQATCIRVTVAFRSPEPACVRLVAVFRSEPPAEARVEITASAISTILATHAALRHGPALLGECEAESKQLPVPHTQPSRVDRGAEDEDHPLPDAPCPDTIHPRQFASWIIHNPEAYPHPEPQHKYTPWWHTGARWESKSSQDGSVASTSIAEVEERDVDDPDDSKCFPLFPVEDSETPYAQYMRSVMEAVEDYAYDIVFKRFYFCSFPTGVSMYWELKDLGEQAKSVKNNVGIGRSITGGGAQSRGGSRNSSAGRMSTKEAATEEIPCPFDSELIGEALKRILGAGSQQFVTDMSHPLEASSQPEAKRVVATYVSMLRWRDISRSNGQLLPHIKEEARISFEDWEMVRSLGLAPHDSTVPTNVVEHARMSKQAWLDSALLFAHAISAQQISLFPPERGIGERHSLLFGKRDNNIYSEEELRLLNWLNDHYEKGRRTLHESLGARNIMNFDKDLNDGLVFACVTLHYCPYLDYIFTNMIPYPQNLEELSNNAMQVLLAWRTVRLPFTVRLRDLVFPIAVKMVLLTTHLFTALRELVPHETVTLEAPLSTSASCRIVLNNTSDEELEYSAIFIRNTQNLFSLVKKDPRIVLPPKKKTLLVFKYDVCIMNETKCTLLLWGCSKCPTFGRSFVITLVGKPSNWEPNVTFEITAPLYKMVNQVLEVPIPYKKRNEYVIYYSEGEAMGRGEKWEDLRSECLPRQIFLNQNTLVMNEGESIAPLSVTCCPFIAKHTHMVYLYCMHDDGQFIVKITLKSRSPLKSKVDQYTCELPPRWAEKRCGCGPEATEEERTHCPLSAPLAVPAVNARLWESLTAMFRKTVTEEETLFWEKHIDSSLGRKLLVWMIKGSRSPLVDLYSRIVQMTAEYNLTVRSPKGERSPVPPKTFVIDGVHEGGMATIHLHVSPKAEVGDHATLRMISPCGREIRDLAVKFTAPRTPSPAVEEEPMGSPGAAGTEDKSVIKRA